MKKDSGNGKVFFNYAAILIVYFFSVQQLRKKNSLNTKTLFYISKKKSFCKKKINLLNFFISLKKDS